MQIIGHDEAEKGRWLEEKFGEMFEKFCLLFIFFGMRQRRYASASLFRANLRWQATPVLPHGRGYLCWTAPLWFCSAAGQPRLVRKLCSALGLQLSSGFLLLPRLLVAVHCTLKKREFISNNLPFVSKRTIFRLEKTGSGVKRDILPEWLVSR